ncbi:hydrolase, alpha/beta domain protein [delta proteobacterium NaphS2]|nr:hydrolase, alpha/beta domain protein [delta proteobacterium NaphS2]
MFLETPGIYYEIHGEGEPLLLLNGIMMNTLSWAEHISLLKDHFQVIVYDMRDQGQSARLEEGYDIGIHADDLKILLDHLNIRRTHLFGVSYGGQVGMNFTLKYPDMVDRLVLANTCAHVDQYLRSMGDMWKRAAKLYDGEAFFDLALIPIYSRKFYNEQYEWLVARRQVFKEYLTREWFDAFIRLASSNTHLDIRTDMARIDHPTLLIAAQEDIITPHGQMIDMSRTMPDSRIVCVPETGHGAVLEKIDIVCMLIKGFLRG